jgi:phenylalanyl-tRNA synthetase beta chain
VDLLEEFLRIYGYDNIAEATEVTIPIHLHSLSSDAFFDLMCKIKRYFLGRGFQEIITNSLVPNRYQENNAIRLQNPLSDQLAVLRTNFLHSHIEIALNHLHRQEKRVQFMEIGKVYFQSDTRYNEAWQLALTLGSYPEKDWRKKDIRLSYYDLYETISAFLATLDMPYKVQFLDASPYFSYGLRLFIDDQPIGLFGHVHPDLLVEYEMPIPLFHGTLSLEFLFDHYRSRHITFKPLREYPAVERDLSFFIEKGKITYALIQQTLQNLAINTLESYSLFDVYEQDDQVSLALRFRFRALDRTLTDKEVNQWMETIMSTLSAIPGIKLRIEPTLTA